MMFYSMLFYYDVDPEGGTQERAYLFLARGHLFLNDYDAGFRPLTKTLPPPLLLGGVVMVGLPWFPSESCWRLLLLRKI